LTIFFPRAFFQRVEDIRGDFLRQEGIKGVIVDLDNTLAPRDSTSCPETAAAWIRHLQEEGFRLLLLSNAPTRRVRQFQSQTGIDAIPSAMKPLFGVHRKAIVRLGLFPDQVAVVGDQVFTDILGGNLAGAYTILVRPLAQGSDHFWTKLVRFLEGPVLRAYFARKG
jgi:HAD superfamily phosphatase (TIGR01668 family)